MENGARLTNDDNYKPIDRIEKFSQYLIKQNISFSFEDHEHDTTDWMTWAEHTAEIFDQLLSKALPQSIYDLTLDKEGLTEHETKKLKPLIANNIRKEFNIAYLSRNDEETFFNALMDVAFHSIQESNYIGDITLDE